MEYKTVHIKIKMFCAILSIQRSFFKVMTSIKSAFVSGHYLEIHTISVHSIPHIHKMLLKKKIIVSLKERDKSETKRGKSYM